MTTKTLQDVQAGDTVVITDTGRAQRLATVDRVTKTQIVIGGTKYRKDNGYMVGSGSWSRGGIRIPEEGEVEELQEKARQQKEKWAEEAKARKESMRGRTLGYLKAACGALSTEKGEEASALQIAVYSLYDAMREAERTCGNRARSFEEMGDNLRAKSEGKGPGVFGFSHQAIFEAHAAYETHRVLERLAGPLINAVAEHLGITVQELIAPYAKDEASS